jgi:tRNA (adenine22-N1)-methyltransferase
MDITLSERLDMVAGLVHSCDYLADIGTDHAYLPIYLVKKGIVRHAVAADISKGSCDKALKNISAYNLEDSIEVRCGNGLEVMAQSEQPDVIVIAGMGGMLAVSVLKSHPCGSNAPRLILQVQRDIDTVRRHLHATGYKIEAEQILKENDKVYVAIAAVKGTEPEYTETEYYFGKLLLAQKNPVLKEYMEHEQNKIKNVLKSIDDRDTEEIQKRRAELVHLNDIYEEAFKCL